MSLLPRVRPVCGRCGKPREGIRHVCRSNSRKRATVRLATEWDRCPRCRRPKGFLGLHKCGSARGDFKRRSSAWGKAQKSATSRPRTTGKPAHLYQSCNDQECARPACVAYKLGLRLGREEGEESGYERGYDAAIKQGHQ